MALWLITDNEREYTSDFIMKMLGDMNISHVQTVEYNLEEKGIAERLNLSLMNAVSAELDTASLDWTYWTLPLPMRWTNIISSRIVQPDSHDRSIGSGASRILIVCISSGQ